MPNAEDDSPLLVFTTLANESDAQSLVHHLVTQRLAACGTIIGRVRSVYRWKGKMANEEESFVILKSRRSRWEALRAELQRKHPYEVPELIAVPASDGLPAYLRWIAAETAPIGTEDP